jgi:hypothetical protein
MLMGDNAYYQYRSCLNGVNERKQILEIAKKVE